MRKLCHLHVIKLVVTQMIVIRALPHIRSVEDSLPSWNPKIEIKPNIAYAPPIKIKTRLEFVHITKTGGSTIVHAAAQKGMNWGECHFKPCSGGHYPDLSNSMGPSVWHRTLNELHSMNFYGDDAALFVVIRNPYERVISHYYYTQRNLIDVQVLNQKEHLNDWIKSTMQFKLHLDRFIAFFYPAYNYVFDKYTGEQVVDYILRFETLEQDFDALMKEFHLNISLDKIQNARHTSAILGVESYTRESIQIINDYFYNDFITFGYEMI